MDRLDLEFDYPEVRAQLDLMAYIFMHRPKIAERIKERIERTLSREETVGKKKPGRHARFEERVKQRYSDLRCFAAVWWYSESEGMSCNRRRKARKHLDRYPAYEEAAEVVNLTPSTVKKAYLRILRLVKENPSNLSTLLALEE